MRILIVEDDPGAAAFLRQGLEEEGHAVDLADNGEEGMQLGRNLAYDLLILDVQLPRRDGVALARGLRDEHVATPILMLTARDATEDVVRGLDAGADDYLTKPFAFDELLARVRAATRRPGSGVNEVLTFDDLELDRLHRIVRRGSRCLDLSPREFRLLEYLLLHQDQVVTRTRLLETVWDMSFDPGTNVVDAHMSNLRRKLEHGGEARVIQTIRGAGYALRSAGALPAASPASHQSTGPR